MTKLNHGNLQCPLCANIIKDYGGTSTKVKCHYCGNICTIDSKNSDENSDKKIIIFTKSIDDFEAKIELAFINDEDIDRDIFKKAWFNDVKQLYLPMYMFEVEISNITSIVRSAPKPNEKFSVLTLATEDATLPTHLKEAAQAIKYSRRSMRDFDTKYLSNDDEIKLFPHKIDSDLAWNNYAIDAVKKGFKESLMLENPMEKEVNAICDKVNIERTSEPISVFVAFWHTSYVFNNVEYHVFMDGSGEVISYSFPKDFEIKNLRETIKKRRKETSTIMLVLLICSIALFFVIGFVSIIFFVLGLAILTLPTSLKNEKLKKLISKCKLSKEEDWRAMQSS